MKKLAGIVSLFALLLALCAPAPTLAAEGEVIIQNLRTVADLPVCNADRLGQIYMISDGDDATDCSSGGSSTLVFCSCDGSAPWVQLGTLLGISDSASLSSYVLITKAGQQSITASGAGNDVTLVAADDVLLTPADDFVVTPTAGSVTLNAVGAGEDVSLVAADDVLLTPTDDLTVSAADVAVGATTTIAFDAAGSTDELGIAENSVSVGSGVAFRIVGGSAPPAACAAGTKGTVYYDTDINKMCVCNGTNYVLMNDDSTTTGCS